VRGENPETALFQDFWEDTEVEKLRKYSNIDTKIKII
jgi:hypothetical protein